MSDLPTLVVVSGPPGSGKTTLAHAIARAIGCPAICRDEIKEGMVHAGSSEIVLGSRDELSLRTLPTFFSVLELLISNGVTTVAEAAFQDRLWRPGLDPLRSRARIRIVHCVVKAEVALTRILRRWEENPLRQAHGESPTTDSVQSAHLHSQFGWVTIDAPSMQVDTTDGYVPGLDRVVAFINS